MFLGAGFKRLRPQFSFKLMKKEDVYNLALGRVGAARYADGSPQGEHCVREYEGALNELLCAGRWSFATRAEMLCGCPRETGTYYALPDDCIRLLECREPHWELMGRELVVEGDGPERLRITYLTRDLDELPDHAPLFIDALVCLLAAKIAPGVTGDFNLTQALRQEYHSVALPAALHAEMVQSWSNDQHPGRGIRNKSLRNRRGNWSL